ncbi:MAG: hypothetical protein WC421_08675 [Elusimicrobiales bacterium]
MIARLWRYRVWILLACAAAACAAAFGSGYVGFINDDARHVLAAQSLLHGNYSTCFLPQPQPIDNLLPGYPLVIAPFLALGGLTAVKLLSAAATLLGVWAAFLCFGLAAAVVYALHPLVIGLSHTAMTEPLFTAWTVAALYFLKKSDWKLSPALAAFCVFASWIRPEGFLFLLAITPACAARLDGKERWRYGIFAALFFAAPYMRNMLVSDTPAGYFREIVSGKTAAETFAKLWPGLKENILFYFQRMPEAAFANPWPAAPVWVRLAVVWGFWAIFVRGMYAALKSADAALRAAAVYVFLMTGLHLVWVNYDTRYLVPVIPFILPVLLAGLPRRAAPAAAAAAALLAAWSGAAHARMELKHPIPTPRVFAWLRANTGSGDYLMASLPEAYSVNTGRKIYPFYKTSNPDAWYDWLLRSGTAYVVFDNVSLIKSMPERETFKNGVRDRTASFLTDKDRFRNIYLDAEEQRAVFRVTPPPGFRGDFAAMIYAEALSAAGKHETALAALRALEKKKAPLKRLDFSLGTALLLSGQPAQSLPYLERAAKAEPDFPLAARHLETARKNSAQ